MPRYRTFEEHMDAAVGPKRMLALDGGGLRGMLTVGLLRKLEQTLRQRFDDPGMRLCDYFDLIGGTSTGAIIAAGLSLGMTVDDVEAQYRKLGHKVFKKSFWRRGIVNSAYDAGAVADALQDVFGSRTLASTDFRTGLMVLSKRYDTGSAWPLTNNRAAKYFGPHAGSSAIPNGEYPLWQVVRASTAAPTFFDPEHITIQGSGSGGQQPIEGQFIDGGVSPFNNPALQMLMMATMQGYRFNWPTGPDKLLLVSLGTGKANPEPGPTTGLQDLAAAQGILALKSLMEDCSDVVETVLQWLSQSPTARTLDREMEKADPPLGNKPTLSYLRYNVIFRADWFKQRLGVDRSADSLREMEAMDEPAHMDALLATGTLAAQKLFDAAHLDSVFDQGVRLD